MLKRKPAPFEQQRVSVPIEEQEQICFANRQYRQHIVVRSADAVCTARDAIRRCCQSGRHKRQTRNLLANRQYRQHIVVRSADVVCTARGAIRRCCQCRDVSRGVNDLLNPCVGSFCNFLRQKVERERLEAE